MIIDRIYLQNFRSYDNEGITLPFSPNVNAIIGENNVGKTTIIAALKKILILNSDDSPQDYFAREVTKELKISIKCIFDDSEILQLISALSLPYDIKEFLTFFSNEVEYTYIRNPGKAILKIRIGFLYLETGGSGNSCRGYLDPNHPNEGQPGIAWGNVIEKINHDKSISPEIIIQTLFKEFSKSNRSNYSSIEFQTNVCLTIISLIKSKIILLDEFREKPQTTFGDLSSNTTGKELIKELYNLKMGEDITDRNNYAKIQKQFKQLFPHLEMDIIQTGTNYQIETRKKNIVSTTFFIGSGIIQTLFLLTHIYAHPKTILFIDTPELQLHPHIQRRIGSLLKSFQGSQIIILTHSQYFLTISKGFQLVRLIQENGKTRAIYSDEGFTEEDYNVFDQMLTIDNMEFFFSRFVLLVEGLSDQWVMQIFASSIGFDLDEHGISIVPVNGKDRFKQYPKLLEEYQIPWIIMADEDAKTIVDSVKTKYPHATAIMHNGELEDILNQDYMREARQLFGNGKEKSDKPLKTRYAAKKMVENGLLVPSSINQVILELKRWCDSSNV